MMTGLKQITRSNAISARRHTGAGRLVVIAGILVVAVVGVVILFGSGVLGGSNRATVTSGSPEWAEVRVEAIPITVVSEGDLIAKDQLDIINLIDHPDDERIEWIVEEGTWVNGPTLDENGEIVEEGDLLYTLSAPGLVSDRDEWISRVREAKAEVEEAERNLEIEKDTSASAEDKAKLELELAHLAHKQWELGVHKQKINDLNLALVKAQRELNLATRDLAYSKELYAKDFISRSELEQDEIRLLEAESALDTAKLDIEVYSKYEKTKLEKEKLSDIEQAKQEMARTIRKNKNKEELLLAKIESERNELIQRETRLADLERMVRAMEVRAPRSGMVIYSSTIGVGREKWLTIRKGARIYGGHRVMVLSNTAQMVANLYVHESRINEIKRGQVVSVRVTARPEDVFKATVVGKKNSAVQSGNGNPHLRQYQVFADLPKGLGDDIRPGMNCSGEIYIRNIPDALALPIQAVHTEGAEHFVYVEAEGGKVRRQLIELGGASDTLVQVTTGLDAGTRVLLRNPQPGELLRDAVEPAEETVADKPEPAPFYEPKTEFVSDTSDADNYAPQDSSRSQQEQDRQQRRKEKRFQRETGEAVGGKGKKRS